MNESRGEHFRQTAITIVEVLIVVNTVHDKVLHYMPSNTSTKASIWLQLSITALHSASSCQLRRRVRRCASSRSLCGQ